MLSMGSMMRRSFRLTPRMGADVSRRKSDIENERLPPDIIDVSRQILIPNVN